MFDFFKKHRLFRRLILLLPFLILFVAAAVYTISGHSITVQDILSYTPANPAAAACVLILLCGLKSLTVFFPIMVLFIACGMLFSTPVAICVGAAGAALCISIPYWLARLVGSDLTEPLFHRYPKLEQLKQLQQKNDFFFSYIARVVGILPCDIVSLYMGTIPLSYKSYVSGGVLGFLPGIIIGVLIGTNANDPASPEFFLSILCEILLCLGSSAGYWLWKKKSNK